MCHLHEVHKSLRDRKNVPHRLPTYRVLSLKLFNRFRRNLVSGIYTESSVENFTLSRIRPFLDATLQETQTELHRSSQKQLIARNKI
jgi:hypothetical protein